MAQSREKRRRRPNRRPAVRQGYSTAARRRHTRLRRVVIAFLVLVGLAGILAISATGDEEGAPPNAPGSAGEPSR